MCRVLSRCLVGLLVALIPASAQDAAPTQAFAVWDARCIKAIKVDPSKTRIEMPMTVDHGEAKPDRSKAVIIGEIAEFNWNCYHIEVRKIQ